MLKVGITGGIGSGKSTVCRVFEWLGIPVYYADDRAKWLMVHDLHLRAAILALLGNASYHEDGTLNRTYIAEKVFQNKELLLQLNALVHPVVHRDGELWHRVQQAPYTLREAALLYESGGFHLMDRMIVVTAPIELRIQRVMARDGVDRKDVESRIARQMAEEEKVKLADFVIHNDEVTPLLPQILEVHHKLLEIGAKKEGRND
jgi:dephospho-CoA kinase